MGGFGGWLGVVEALDLGNWAHGAMSAHGWTPAEIAAVPLCQIFAFWGENAALNGWRPGRHFDAASQLDLINKARAKKGLPPVKSRRPAAEG